MKELISKYKSYKMYLDGDVLSLERISPKEQICDFDLEGVKDLVRAGQGDCDHCDPVLPNIFLTDRVTHLEKSNEQRKKDIKHSWNVCDRLQMQLSVLQKNHNDLYAKFGVIEKEVNTAPLYDFSKRIVILQKDIKNLNSRLVDANEKIVSLQIAAEKHEAGTLCHTECPIKVTWEENQKVSRTKKTVSK